METIHEKIKNAVRLFVGKEMTTSQIKAAVLGMYPGTSEGSILPNDHADGNKHPCWCAKTPNRIFDRIDRNRYIVRM